MCIEENGEPAIFVETEGKRIAKRSHHRTWISLEPGWVVRDYDYPNGIEIEYHGATVQ